MGEEPTRNTLDTPSLRFTGVLTLNLHRISFVVSELGRRGGKVGRKRRLVTMTAKERKKARTGTRRGHWKKGRGEAN
jgi:hypothetical protein